MHKIIFTIIVLLISLNTSTVSAADEIPWDLLNNGNPIGEEHKALATKALGEIKGYAICKEDMITCLQQYPDNKSVLRQANYIVRRCIIDRNLDLVKGYFKQRMLSLYGSKRYEPKLQNLVPSGNPNAPIKVVVYADFQCPYCRLAVPALRRISKKHPELMTLYFKNYPIKSHEYSLSIATSLIAADKQGKFWEMLDLLYKLKGYDNKSHLELAKKLKLNPEQFEQDLKSSSVLNRIKSEKLEAISFDIFSTPVILINGKLYSGPKSYEELLDILEEELDIIQGRQ